jgi:hypothetical protein
MRAWSLCFASSLIFVACGSTESNPDPGSPSDAAVDQTPVDAPIDAQPDAEADVEPEAMSDALPDTTEDVLPDTVQPDGGDAGPPTGELLLQGGPADRVVPHLAARSDGTTFLSWYALSGDQYAVRMQRLESAGQKLWADDGVEVSAVSSTSWVMDYDLAADALGNAVLAYSNTTDFAVRVQRVDENGATAWGQGTVLTTPITQGFTPHVVLGSDGAMAVAWDEERSQGPQTTQHVVVQRVDATGAATWPTPYDVGPSGNLSPMFSQILAGEDGGVIVSWVENGGVNHPGDAYAQLVDAQGHAVWGAKKKINGADQLAYPMRPILASDGQGGFFAAWSAVQGMASFQGRIQHFDADGNAAWDAQGLRVSSESSMMQLPSAMEYVPGADQVVVAWKRTDANQSTSGLHVQAFDAQGTKLWEDVGLEVVAADMVDGALAADVRATSQGAALFFAKGPVNGMNLTSHVAAMPFSANATPAISDLSTVSSGKSHPAVSGLVGGGYWLVWEDTRDTVPAIYGAWWPSP